MSNQTKSSEGFEKQVYRCSACGDLFDRNDLGHCIICGHHYLAGSVCGNCHNDKIENTMTESGFTLTEWIKDEQKKPNG
jgi:rRNA maturation endonuclease Nob1